MLAEERSKQNVLVLGAYGLIGQSVSAKLAAEGFDVTGLGRNPQLSRVVLPDIPRISRDIKELCDDGRWREIIAGFSIVVNCSGALQDGPEDDLEAIHHHAVAALANACVSENVGLIQISAVGARPDASTAFLSSKGRGDAAIKQAGGDFHIFRPGLVLGRNAYGGTIMLRMLAAFPLIQPIAAPASKIQTIALDDLANVVVAAAKGQIPCGFDGDLLETEAHSLRELVAQLRHALGFRPASFEITLPAFCLSGVSRLADALSWLGWKSPLRSTAVRVLTEGIQGKAADLTEFGLPPLSSLNETLGSIPVGAQDRLFARVALLAPLILLCLCLFWVSSGLIGILRAEEAALVLQNAGWSANLAMGSVLFWSFVDLMVGVAFAIRKYAKAACWAAIGVTLIYLVASTLIIPALWFDPLGPLIKVIPAIALALVARIALDVR